MLQFVDYLSIFRRRRLYLVLGLVVGLAAGWFTAPGTDRPPEYQGVHTLLVNPNSSAAQTLNLEQAQAIVETGGVPGRVNKRLDADGLPRFTEVVAEPDTDVRSLKITAYSPSREGAAAAANYFAEELNRDLVGAQVTQRQEKIATSTTQTEVLRVKLSDLDRQIASLPPDDPARETLGVERSAVASAYQAAQGELQALQSADDPRSPLRTLQAATGGPRHYEGWKIPDSRPIRALMLGGFGLLLGMAGAIAADRMDVRIRNKADAERAFDLPVIVEIPALPSGTKGRELLVSTMPASPFVEAYRALRTVVIFAAEPTGDGEAPHGGADGSAAGAEPEQRAQVILVTSPSSGEGKTTTVGHLAALLAEFGKSVLVISADFRRPRVHELFDLPRQPGLADVLDHSAGGVRLSDVRMATSFEGVHLLPSGGPVTNPAQLLTETRHLIEAARSIFDYVVIDTPPLLVANDATELAACTDMVILIAKADRTSREAARRSTEILRRVDAPVLGAVVSSSHDALTAYGYYRYQYYAESDQGLNRGTPQEKLTRKERRRNKGQSESGDPTTSDGDDPSGHVSVGPGGDQIDQG